MEEERRGVRPRAAGGAVVKTERYGMIKQTLFRPREKLSGSAKRKVFSERYLKNADDIMGKGMLFAEFLCNRLEKDR